MWTLPRPRNQRAPKSSRTSDHGWRRLRVGVPPHTLNGSHRHDLNGCRGHLRSSLVEVLKRQQTTPWLPLSHTNDCDQESIPPRRGSSPNQTQPWPSCPGCGPRATEKRGRTNKLLSRVVVMIWTMYKTTSVVCTPSKAASRVGCTVSLHIGV